MKAFFTRKISILHNKKYREYKKNIYKSIRNARKNGRFDMKFCAVGMSVSNATAIEKHLKQKKFDVEIVYCEHSPNYVFSIEVSW